MLHLYFYALYVRYVNYRFEMLRDRSSQRTKMRNWALYFSDRVYADAKIMEYKCERWNYSKQSKHF